MLICVVICLAALAGLLVSERRNSRRGVWIFKPLASTAFIATALAAGALESDYGRWILLALVLSWFGDIFLIPRERPAIFQAGILSFLLGHVGFAAAFVQHGLDPMWLGIALVATAAAALPTLRWLLPHVPDDMRLAVRAYIAVITAMVVCAAGAVGHAGQSTILLGALMFYVSDLSVARDRFVTKAFSNRVWGLPLYYGGQLVLASTVP